jgi:hypothetical protein
VLSCVFARACCVSIEARRVDRRDGRDRYSNYRAKSTITAQDTAPRMDGSHLLDVDLACVRACHRGVTGVFQRCTRGVTRVLHGRA